MYAVVSIVDFFVSHGADCVACDACRSGVQSLCVIGPCAALVGSNVPLAATTRLILAFFLYSVHLLRLRTI